MAFSFGFFNAKNLDRTYTAENFNDYLGSIICDGIQDNFGQCFNLSASKLKLTIGSGKAWIQGHYFISDTAYTYDLSRYVDESLPRYMAVGICCNTSENVRNVSFEILAGTPATNPAIPRFQNTDYKKYLTLCIIRLDEGTSELSITDYRENNNFCGYVRCILGKCKVTDMLSQLSEIQTQIKDYNITVSQLATKINKLTLKIDEMTGDVVSIGKCGQSVDFVLYSDGRLLLKGIGATFDYSTDSNPSPLQNNTNIKSVIVSEGVTGIGERLFQYCDNLKTVSLPTTLTANMKRYPLSGIIQCGYCGKNYQRKMYPQGGTWLCATFLRRRKKYCPKAKQIPENILYEIICDVLHLPEFDERMVRDNIQMILVPKACELVFVFHDGHTEQRHWEHRSRSESWTDKMKKQASERSKKCQE